VATKKEHHDYIEKMGLFKIECNPDIFDLDEKYLLRNYGHWMKALTDGTLTPFTEEQKLFVQVFSSKERPFTPEQVTWFKYITRCKMEKDNPDKFKLNYQADAEDPFYTRDDWKKMRSRYYG